MWLERNRLIFRGEVRKGVPTIGTQIIAVAQFWCRYQKYNAIANLTCMFPSDANDLLGNLLLMDMDVVQDTIFMLDTRISSIEDVRQKT